METLKLLYEELRKFSPGVDVRSTGPSNLQALGVETEEDALA
jgi:hypothetical protein